MCLTSWRTAKPKIFAIGSYKPVKQQAHKYYNFRQYKNPMSKHMSYITLVNKLEYDQKKCELDQKKIRAIFDYIGLTAEDYNEKECFK